MPAWICSRQKTKSAMEAIQWNPDSCQSYAQAGATYIAPASRPIAPANANAQVQRHCRVRFAMLAEPAAMRRAAMPLTAGKTQWHALEASPERRSNISHVNG